ncbi:hypothetical protein [Kitasatospora sp. NPDC050543]|uniref:hypothetical protein n=1 Tax=Kitasatospora sp. NPDC050543 TaxID=3364054 RepID=UPI0037B45E04
MPDRLVFHESFDSTRATAADPDDHPNLAQAQAEAVVSLLLGRSLSVNHTYAFDSRGMLDLADVVLETWHEAVKTASGTGRAELTRARPFVLHRFNQPTFFAACSDQLRRSDPDSKNYFKLSAWQPIDQLPSVRHALADALTREHGGGAKRRLPAEISGNEQLSRYLELLRRLNVYFSEFDRSRDAANPRISLAAYVTRLVELPEGRLVELAAEHHCPEPDARRLQAAVSSKVAQSKYGTAAVNRGWVHGGADLADRDPLMADQLRELVDTLYNAMLAESACARFDYMSSVPRVDGRDELKHVNALAMALIDDTREAHHDRQEREGIGPSPRMAGIFAAAETVPNLTAAPLRKVFDAYWALVADDERRPAWQDSCEDLDRLLARRRPVDRELQHAWASHLAQLQTGLPQVVAVERGRLAVPVSSSDNGCVQTMGLGELTEEELNRSFAAGEYLSDLARSLRMGQGLDG